MKNCFGVRSFVGNGPAGAFFMPDHCLEKIPTEIYKDRFAVTHFTVQPTTYETKQGH